MEGFRTCGKRQKKNKWRAENKTRGSRNRVEDSVLVQGKGMRTKMKAWRAGTAKLVKGQNWLIPDHLNIPGLAWHTVSRCIVSVRSFIFQESCSTHHPSFQCHHLSMGLDACGHSLPPPSCSDHSALWYPVSPAHCHIGPDRLPRSASVEAGLLLSGPYVQVFSVLGLPGTVLCMKQRFNMHTLDTPSTYSKTGVFFKVYIEDVGLC